MQAIQWLITVCIEISVFFWHAYLETSSWWTPFNLIAPLLLWISDAFIDLAQYLSTFSSWVSWAQDWISKILSWDAILSLIQPYIDWAIYAYNWVKDAYSFVRGWIDDWWLETKTTVSGWIDVATQGFNTLKTEWDNFWKVTFPTLLDWFKLENWWGGKLFAIDGLIGSKLAEWFPWYDDLAQSIDGILTFFTDPAKAVYELFDFIIDRFWEDS